MHASPADGIRWHAASRDWRIEMPNPFTVDGSYGPGWSCFHVTESDDDRRANGRGPNGLYAYILGRSCERLHQRLADFLQYEASHGRQVIVSWADGTDVAALVHAALAQTPPADWVREGDARWLVHSTGAGNWDAIEHSGELLSRVLLRERGIDTGGVGESEFGEPADYSEYVMLGRIESIASEYVVACQTAGRALPDPETVYEPGTRIYFDAHRIIQDGLAVRDGLHEIKVRGRLPLKPYMATEIGVRDIDPGGEVRQWTTTRFLNAANELFLQRQSLT